MDGEPGTDEATAQPAAGTAGADETQVAAAERDQVAGDEAGAGTDQPTPAELQERIDALTTQVGEQETRHASQLETARRSSDAAVGAARTKWDRDQEAKTAKDRATALGSRIKSGETDEVEALVGLVHEAIDRPQAEADAFQNSADALRQGAASAFSYRVERLQPDKATEQRYMTLFQSGRHAELDQALLEAEKEKWGTPAGETNESKRREQEEVAARRRGKRPDLSGGKSGGGVGFKTKMEARTLHVQNKISNARMKEINADPTIPEQ